MKRSRSFACVVFVLSPIACGGASKIGEAGDADSGGGAGVSGSSASGSSGTTENGGSGGTAGTGSSGTPGAGGSGAMADGGTGGTAGGSGGTVGLPCDILARAGHLCVAAHSTVRALVESYSGNLYQVEAPDGSTLDIGIIDGYADAAAQDSFCAGRPCVVSVIYDQTPFGNHLTPSPPGGAKPTPGDPAAIWDLPTTIDGRSVYGIRFRPGQGYRAACDECPYPSGASGAPLDDEPQTIYMVTSQHDLVNGCCFEYGNAETTSEDDGNGSSEALYFGAGVIWGTGSGEKGPWVMADLENGLYAGWEHGQDRNISTNTPLEHDFVTALLVGDTADKNGGQGRFALYGGDATSGPLKTMYDGIRPERPGYAPMHKQGSIILSIAGDNSDTDGGRFYEGVIARGAATKTTVNALHSAIVSARYGQ